MTISISNIAWDVTMDAQVAQLLNQYDVKHIDIAPPKYFSTPSKTTLLDIDKVRNFWLSHEIAPIGMQSLLFGTQGLNIFASKDVQDEMLQHLTHICRIGGKLGASKLVFGSPRNRDRLDLNDKQTMDTAVVFFNQLGDIAQAHNVVVCLEPNPRCYNANFMVDSLETANVVACINHPNIRMQLDIGAMCINNENPKEVLRQVHPWIEHIHISEPQLAPLNLHNKYHQRVAPVLKHYFPEMPMTIEMLTSTSELALEEIDKSIQLVQSLYKRSYL